MDTHPENDARSWLTSYNNHLRDVVGTAVTTRSRYSCVIQRFIGSRFEDDAGWARLSVQRVTDFVREEAASKKRCGRRLPVTAVRFIPALLSLARHRCAYRKSSPSILVMQSAQDRTGQNASRRHGGM